MWLVAIIIGSAALENQVTLGSWVNSIYALWESRGKVFIPSLCRNTRGSKLPYITVCE